MYVKRNTFAGRSTYYAWSARDRDVVVVAMTARGDDNINRRRLARVAELFA
jgi:hypothetical protein